MTDLLLELSEKGYVISPSGFLAPNETDELLEDYRELERSQRFRSAGVGKNLKHQLSTEIRRDQILWFEPEALLPGQAKLWFRLQRLKDDINRELFAGLWDLEGHFALYPRGGFYRRHLDRFSNDDARAITVTYYLNESWRPEDGGELVIYDGDREILVEPRLGTLVIFRSDQLEHEVRESKTERRSFAGWFRRRPK